MIRKDLTDDGKLIIEIEGVLKAVPERREVVFTNTFVNKAKSFGLDPELVRRELTKHEVLIPRGYFGSYLDEIMVVNSKSLDEQGIALGNVFFEFNNGELVRVIIEHNRDTVVEIYGEDGRGELFLRKLDEKVSTLIGYYGRDKEILLGRAEKTLQKLLDNGILPFEVFATDFGDTVVVKTLVPDPVEGLRGVVYGVASGVPFSESPHLAKLSEKILELIS